MGTEIERKFLVANAGWREGVRSAAWFRQGYLANTSRASVRVRVAAEGWREDSSGAVTSDLTEAWLSVKSMTPGLVRQEFEYRVPVDEAESLLALCEGPLLEKVRHFVPVSGPAGEHLFEIDEFLGANAGLVVAEVELDHPDEPFPQPHWLGCEVTRHERYYNFRLATYPYGEWTDLERNPE
jgi:adenylate cyclase